MQAAHRVRPPRCSGGSPPPARGLLLADGLHRRAPV